MSDPREVVSSSAGSNQHRNTTRVNSPRSPVKLEDYANIKRPPKQQQQRQQESQRTQDARVNSPRSPVKLEDYANTKRPPKQQQRQQESQRTQGVDNSAANNNGRSPFQRELESALRERKKRGLVTGLSDSENSTVDGAEIDNNNGNGYLSRVHQDHSDHWHANNDSIPFNSDVSLNQSNEVFDHHNDPPNHSTGPTLSQRSSLFEFENLETVMNQQSQSSTGLGDVLEESGEEDASRNGSERSDAKDGNAANWSGLDGSSGILQLDDNDGSGLMNENELRDQGVLFQESSGDDDVEEEEEGDCFHGDVNLPEEDSNLMMKMYMEASPRPPGYLSDEVYEEDGIEVGNDGDEEDYIESLRRASVDDMARDIAESDVSNNEDSLQYSDGSGDGYYLQNGDAPHRFQNGDVHDLSNGHADELESQEFDDDRESRTSLRSDRLSQDGSEHSEAASPELGNTVIRNEQFSAAILTAASNVESFVDEPEGGESDATSVSLGQFVPNAVRRTRLPPPGQRRSSLKGRKESSGDLVVNKQNITAIKASPRTTPRRSKSNSPRSVCSNASSSRGSIKSNPQSEMSARGSVSEEYLAALNRSDNSDVDIPNELPTLMSMYLNNDGRFKFHQRPEGVPPLDFGNSINSNISFLPRDDDRARSQAEEFAEQLQKDYDDLLAKYAQAENTIDQLRLGAKVDLYGDDPVPGQAVQGSYSAGKQPGMIQFSQPQKASVQHVLTTNTHSHSHTTSGSYAIQPIGGERSALSTVREDGYQDNAIPGENDDDDMGFPLGASAGGKAMVLMFQAKDQQERVDAFDELLKQNQLAPPEQKTSYDNLKAAQHRLESNYLQAKEEDSAMRRRNNLFNNGEVDVFDPERAVEGQIFQLGMKLDDIHETVMENLRNQPVDVEKAPSIQDIFPAEEEEERRSQYAYQGHPTLPEAHKPSKIPVLSSNDTNRAEDAEDHAGSMGNKEEEQEEESPSPPFSPSGSSTPGIASPYNGDFDGNYDEHYSGNNHHYPQPSMTSSSPEFAREPKQITKKQPGRSAPRNHSHPSSPRTGSSDHLDNGGTRHKSPEPGDIDSGFMGSESSRQSNQMRPFGYKSSGIDGIRTKARDNKQANQAPQGHRSQKGQRSSSHHGSTGASRDSPLHSEGMDSESEEETMIQVPTKKQNVRNNNIGRQNSIPKASPVSRESHPKHTPQKLKHSPPHQTTPPSSKRHQRHSKASVPARTRDKRGPIQKEPPPRQLLQIPHSSLQNGHGDHQNGHENGGLRSENFALKSLPSSVTKPHHIRPSSTTTRPSRTKKYPHRTAPRAKYDSGSEVSRGVSEVTRSSAKSEAMRALQDQIDDLKKQLQDKNHPPVQNGHQKQPFGLHDRTPLKAEAPYRLSNRTPEREDIDYGRPSGRRTSTAGSTKSEALQALRQELEDIKGQIRQKENTPRSDYRPTSDQTPYSGQQTTPLRDSLRETLRSQFIPQNTASPDLYSRTSLPQRLHSTPYRSSFKTEVPPPKLHVSDLDASPIPAGQYMESPAGQSMGSPAGPTYSRGGAPAGPTYSRGGAHFVSTHTEPCPLCGGSRTHTHSQYHSASPTPPVQHPPAQSPLPVQHPPAQPPPPMQHYPTQPPPQPVMHSFPQSPPPPQGFSYSPMTTGTPTMHPMPTQSYAAPPVMVPTNHQGRQSQPQYAVQNETQHQVYIPAAQPKPALHVREDSTPAVVYITPSRRKARYYSRDDTSSSSNDEDVELYYRRTPRSSTSKAPRSSKSGVNFLRKSLHTEVSYEDDGMDKSLDSALSMARRLKKSSHKMLSSVRNDLNRSSSLRESGFY